MNRYFRLFVALLFVAASLATGIAAAQPSESEVSREDVDASDPFVAFGELGFGEDEQRFFHAISHEVVNPQEYLFGDQPNDNPPTLDLPGTHLTCIGAAVVTFPDIDLPTSTTVNGAVYVPSGAGPQPGTDVALMWAKYDRPYDVTDMSFFLNRGFVLPGNSDLGIPAWESTFPGDTWNGGFRMPTLTYGPEPWALTVFEYSPPQTFTPMPMDGFAYLHGDTLIIGVDAGQLFGNLPDGASPPPDGELRFGYHGHDHDGGFGAADGSQSFITTTPEVPGRGYDDFYSGFPAVLQPGSFPITESAPVETTTTAAPATTSAPTTAGATAAPTTVGAAAPATTQAPSSSSDDGGGFLGTFLLIIGILLIIAGLIWWLLFGRPRTSEPKPVDVGGTRVRDPNRGGGTTPPTTLPPTEREHSTCDWSLYFNDGGNRVALRKANFQAHECCVYEIEVATRIDEHVQAARARQDDQGERLRIPDFNFAWAWVDLKANASTRSGPHGRLDWMHGLGDPTEQASLADDDGFWQQGQGEEPPEVAVHLVHRETTRVQVKLIPGCPEYDNSYGTYGRSQLDVMATHECTNDAPGAACPVELNAFGLFTGEIWGGGLWALASDAPGTDIDELERHAEAKRAGDDSAPSLLDEQRPRPLWDGHDHEMRDRATYQANDVASDAGTVDDDSVKIYIETLVDANSGQIVPTAVYPTTERVTTHIESQFDHVVTVDGEMVPKNCESNGCHGHGQCGCAPKFKLQVAGPGGPAGGAGPGGAWIDVDGGAVTILRIPTTANRRTPPAPGGYIPWELKK